MADKTITIEKSVSTSKESWRQIFSILEWIALSAFLLSIILFAYKRPFSLLNQIDACLWGEFGSFVGGVIGTFVAYISVRLLVKTLDAQLKSNEDISKSNERTAATYDLQHFNEMFKTLFELYKNVLNDYKIEGCQNGHESFKILTKQFSGPDTRARLSEDSLDMQGRNNVAIACYEKFYADNSDVLSVHFRILYRIFQLIHTASISDTNRLVVAKIVRCQLSEEELLLLRYNAMTKCGEKMQVYINQYNLLKHLPFLSILEFAPIFDKLKGNTYVNCINVELHSLHGEVRDLFLKRSEKEKTLEKYVGDKKYQIRLTVKQDNSVFKIELIKKNKHNTDVYSNCTKAFDELNNTDLSILLELFVREVFFYSNYNQYNNIDKITITPEITQQQHSKKTIVSLEISHNEAYELICCKTQIENPMKSLKKSS